MEKTAVKIKTLLSVLALVLGLSTQILAQYDPLNSHYVQSPMILNPGYTGFRNTLAFDLSVRRQWMGANGAPTSVFLTGHAPINDSKVSFGASVQQWTSGPLSATRFGADYSYIVRLADRLLLSMGLEVGVSGYKLNTSELIYVDPLDPQFANASYSTSHPHAGLGFVLFSPIFHVGLSKSSIRLTGVELVNENILNIRELSPFCVTLGAITPEYNKFSLGYSFFGRFMAGESRSVMDNMLQLIYDKIYSVGVDYRTNGSMFAMLKMDVSKNWGLTYSYEFALANSSYIQKSSHEITISYDCYTFHRRNKYRMFKRKKPIDESNIRSIRFF